MLQPRCYWAFEWILNEASHCTSNGAFCLSSDEEALEMMSVSSNPGDCCQASDDLQVVSSANSTTTSKQAEASMRGVWTMIEV